MQEIPDCFIKDGFITFYFPISYKQSQFKECVHQLKIQGFSFFQLNNLAGIAPTEQNTQLHVQHELDQFFYPFIQEKLFPSRPSIDMFNRFSRNSEKPLTLQIHQETFSLILKQLDVILCPFETGIISLLFQIDEKNKSLSDCIQMMRYFRQLVPNPSEVNHFSITYEHQQFENTQHYLLDALFSFLKPFIKTQNSDSGYLGSLPFFEDERMFTTAFLRTDEHTVITDELVYRLSQLDGKSSDGSVAISSTNPTFISGYVEDHSYLRWAPHLYTTTTMQTEMTLTNFENTKAQKALSAYLHTIYYNLLIHYFYKIVLLKLTYEHSEIRWSKDKIIAEALIDSITSFTSSYYFGQVAIRSSGRDLSRMIRKQFRIDELFREVKESVNDLYRVLEDEATNRYNQLLFILTVYTVISGIIGMNLVIQDWQEPFNWSLLASYTFFEWITLITAISGIGLSFALIIGAIIRTAINKVGRKRYK